MAVRSRSSVLPSSSRRRIGPCPSRRSARSYESCCRASACPAAPSARCDERAAEPALSVRVASSTLMFCCLTKHIEIAGAKVEIRIGVEQLCNAFDIRQRVAGAARNRGDERDRRKHRLALVRERRRVGLHLLGWRLPVCIRRNLSAVPLISVDPLVVRQFRQIARGVISVCSDRRSLLQRRQHRREILGDVPDFDCGPSP